jgi:hypothetical protein
MSDVDSFLTSLKSAYREGDDQELAALLDPMDLYTRAQLSESLKVENFQLFTCQASS